MNRLTVRTSQREQLLDVTREVERLVREAGMTEGVVTLFVPHTTAGITISENADPTVVTDVLQALALVAPHQQPFYRHDEGNSDAHVKSILVGMSLTVLVEDGRLALGTWQAIYFAEFDGPRTRQLWVRLSD
jgi:secondary thiamine-phosphate synthase enzyme